MCLILILAAIAAVLAVYFVFFLLGTAFALIPWLIVGFLAGWLASAITESPHGFLGDVLIGWAGSIIGGVLFAIALHERVGGLFNPTRFVASVVGAVLLLLVVKAVRGKA